jgi:hypothetical protein
MRKIQTLIAAALLSGCAAQASYEPESPVTSPAYGPQNKVAIFVRGLDEAEVTSLIGIMKHDVICDSLRVVERSAGYAELSCATVDGVGMVANAFQSVAQRNGMDLSVSHAGDHVFLKAIK